MSYLDTCYLIAFIDKKDDIRRNSSKDILRAVKTPRQRYRVSVPTVGEAFLKINSKRTIEQKREAFKTLEGLIESEVIEMIGLGSNSDAFHYAKELMGLCTDSYDQLTPMDALIVADALIDNECIMIYTTDSKLLLDTNLVDCVNEFRQSIDTSYPDLGFSKFKY